MNTSLKREIHIEVNFSVETYVTTCAVYTIADEVFMSHLVKRNKKTYELCEYFGERRKTKGNILQNLIDKEWYDSISRATRRIEQ